MVHVHVHVTKGTARRYIFGKVHLESYILRKGYKQVCRTGRLIMYRSIMYLDHEVVELFFGELRFLMAGPRVLATRSPVFDTIQTIEIAARVGDRPRRAQ